jgi:1-aminocyclopropane-1-carboxylate deaminase/D-cysteine desulfhydrase-like pyridoxal-dependent ACC family enzyme
LVLTGDEPTRYTGNLLLNTLFGSSLYFTGSEDRLVRQAHIAEVTAAIERRRYKPFTIPVGGSDQRGALGHVVLAAEIVEQVKHIGEKPAAILLASATGGTQAGLLTGLRKLGEAVAVIGLVVAKSADDLRADIERYALGACELVDGVELSRRDITVDDRALGGGYGTPTPEAREAIETLARSEGILADPVYTGKGLAGTIALVREGRFASDDAVVFVHTGGVPALFVE